MTEALTPFARLIDLSTNTELASTTNILDWEIALTLDQVGTLSLTVPAGDPGDAASDGDLSFASALMRAATRPGTSDPPLPILIEFSLDGGTAYDSRRLARQPQRTLAASGRAIHEEGADLGDILSTVPIERATYYLTQVDQILNAPAGSTVPQQDQVTGGGLAAGIRGMIPPHTRIPHLAGLLTKRPGLASWPDAARDRLVFTGVVSTLALLPLEMGVSEGTPCNQVQLTVDIDSATVQAVLETLAHRLGGATPDQAQGHVQLDCSDASLNLSGSTDAHDPIDAHNWNPNAAVARSVVVGHKGETAHLTFDATGSSDVDETTHARVHLDQAHLESDDSTVYAEANMVGGRSTAGFPDGATITGLTVINGVTGSISSGRQLWTDCCPVIGLDVGGKAGGLYFTILDNQIAPVAGAPALPCRSMAWDKGSTDRPAALLMGTTHGIFYSEDVPKPHFLTHTSWAPLGNLNADVVRIMVEEDPEDTAHRVVYAHVRGSGERSDGIYRWTSAGGWDLVLGNTAIISFCTTDYKTFWVVKQAQQDRVYRYAADESPPSPAGGFPLPAGKAYAIDRVISVDPDVDSIWALASDGGPRIYKLLNTGGVWGSFTDADSTGTLVDDQARKLAVYRAVGLGVTMDQSYPNSTLANVFLATDGGLYYTQNHLTDEAMLWQQADLGGLTGAAIKNVAAGEGQTVLGVAMNRIFCTTDDDLLYSSSTGRWFDTIKGKDRTTLGPYTSYLTGLGLSNVGLFGPGTGGGSPGAPDALLPDNNVRTWGSTNLDGTPMTVSPYDATTAASGGTHVFMPVQLGIAIPRGFVIERYLNDHLEFEYKVTNLAAHLPGVQMQSLPQIQTNQAQDARTASETVAQVIYRWLQQHSTSQTRITVESSFEDPAAALRTLRPTHKAALVGTITLVDHSSAGAVVSTQPLHFDGSEALWVISHRMRKGPGRTASTETVLSTLLASGPLSAQDMDLSLVDATHQIRTWR